MTRMRSFLPLPRPLPGTLAVALCGLFAAPVLAAPTSQVVTIDGQPTGALTGKSVVVDPGHGLFFHDTYGWIYQRDPINGLHEDKHTNEIVMDWLRPHLEGAGARVLATRAPHRQTVNVIVDNADPGYSETGTFTTTTNTGLGYRGSYRYATTSRLAATAAATWSATLPQRGDLIVADELIHASAHDGIRMSKATAVFARHNDVQSFADLIAAFDLSGAASSLAAAAACTRTHALKDS